MGSAGVHKQGPRTPSPHDPDSIFLKSSWPFATLALALPAPVAPVGVISAGAAVAWGTTALAFLLPKPARGRESAALGTNDTPAPEDAAVAFRVDPASRLSSDNCSVFSPKTIGSAWSSSLPVSCDDIVSTGQHDA